MSEAKFTKGEWEVDFRNDTCAYLNCVPVSYNECFYKNAYDAYLIAAAPSMYAMLEEVAKELYNLIDEVNDQRLSHVHASSLTQPDLHDGETIHNIQLLLAKARGE